MKAAHLAAWSVLLLAVLAGCDPQPRPADSDGRVWYQDTNVSRLVAVERQTSDRIEGNLLRLRTDIRNRTKSEMWVDVQVVWKDATGYELYQTNWAPLCLPPRFTTTHEIACTRADVADYEFRIRKPVRTVGNP